MNHTDVDTARIWIPSQVLIQWVQMIKPRLDNWQASTSLKMLPAERFRFQHRKVGTATGGMDPRSMTTIRRRPSSFSTNRT